MLTKVYVAFAIFLAAIGGAFAQGTAKSKATLNAEVSSNFPNNTTGAITPALAQAAFNDFIASWQQAPATNTQTGASYSVVIGDYGALINFTNAGATTATLPTPTGSFAAFNTYMTATGAGTVTVSATGATINGAPNVTIAPGVYRWFVSDGSGSNYISVVNGTSPPNGSITPPMLASSTLPSGSPMVNGAINAAVAANALTITIQTQAGGTPSAGNPVFIQNPFFSAGTANYAATQVTAAMSITVPSGATLGTVSNQANRIWVAVFNNSGTLVLAVYNSLSGVNILPWDESTGIAPTTIGAGSTNAQTWYSASAIGAASAFRIIGYVESTQTTAGTWAASPSKVQLFGPGQKKPGDIVQAQYNSISVSTSGANATFGLFSTNQSVTITPLSAANLVKVEATGAISVPSAGTMTVRLSRGNTANTNLIGNLFAFGNAGGGANNAGFYCRAMDTPNVSSAQIYSLQEQGSSITTVTPIELQASELMI